MSDNLLSYARLGGEFKWLRRGGARIIVSTPSVSASLSSYPPGYHPHAFIPNIVLAQVHQRNPASLLSLVIAQHLQYLLELQYTNLFILQTQFSCINLISSFQLLIIEMRIHDEPYKLDFIILSWNSFHWSFILFGLFLVKWLLLLKPSLLFVFLQYFLLTDLEDCLSFFFGDEFLFLMLLFSKKFCLLLSVAVASSCWVSESSRLPAR